jgi:hypothetical protein
MFFGSNLEAWIRNSVGVSGSESVTEPTAAEHLRTKLKSEGMIFIIEFIHSSIEKVFAQLNKPGEALKNASQIFGLDLSQLNLNTKCHKNVRTVNFFKRAYRAHRMELVGLA